MTNPETSSGASPRKATKSGPGGIFYGWWVVLAHGTEQVLGSGFFFYGLGTFFLPLANEFGWSRALISVAFSLDRFQSILISPGIGMAFDRLGPRKLVLFGTTSMSIGFLILSQVRSFEALVAAVMFMSAGFAAGFGVTGMATVANWFRRKRSTALGFLMAGSGISGLLVPVVASLIEQFGWRSAAMTIAAVLILVGWPLAFVLRHKPADMGLRPDGDPPDAPGSPWPSGSGQPERPVRIREAVRHPAFWLLGVIDSLKMVAYSAMVVHAIPYLAGLGFPATIAASIVAALTVTSVFGRIGFGWIGDRVPKRFLLAGLLLLQVIGFSIFATISQPWHLAVFLVLFAPAFGGTVPLRPALQADYFGSSSFGTIQGVLVSIVSVGSMVGPVLAGAMFDALGSYQAAFLICAATVALAVPLALALPQPKPRLLRS